jgi:hypothetical protein
MYFESEPEYTNGATENEVQKARIPANFKTTTTTAMAETPPINNWVLLDKAKPPDSADS